MKEFIEKRSVEGEIKITLKNADTPSESKIWKADKYSLCEAIKLIINNYQDQGYKLTLRQLYYQLVSKDYIPNHITVYKKLSSILDDLRYGGMIDWKAIEDRGRVPKLRYWVEDVQDALIDTKNQYRINRQKGQDVHVELWTEKDAISNILDGAIDPFHIMLVVNKGYTSSSAAYSAYGRIVDKINENKKVVILYFGDHDPSGLDMVRDIYDRLYRFIHDGTQLDVSSAYEWYRSFVEDNQPNDELFPNEFSDTDYFITTDDELETFDWLRFFIERHIKVEHIGLTHEQVNKWNPPPNPAKITDPRAKGYIAQYGKTSWEVDAIEPSEIVRLVRDNVRSIINMDTFNEVLQEEKDGKAELTELIDNTNKDN